MKKCVKYVLSHYKALKIGFNCNQSGHIFNENFDCKKKMLLPLSIMLQIPAKVLISLINTYLVITHYPLENSDIM